MTVEIEEKKDDEQKVLEYLKKHSDEAFTAEELEEYVGVSKSDIRYNHAGLIHEVESRRYNGEKHYFCRFKLHMVTFWTLMGVMVIFFIYVMYLEVV